MKNEIRDKNKIATGTIMLATTIIKLLSSIISLFEKIYK